MDASPQPTCPESEAEPRIIPRSQHNISRKNIDYDAVKVLYRLHRHGFLAYLVGGSVRDLLLGRRPKDFDVGTDARPGQIRKLFGNSRIIGRRFRLVQVFFKGGKVIEVSTLRRASDPDEDEVLCANNTFGTPAEDAARRDLTINALFYNIADYSVVDYVGGLEDLKAGLIRAVGDPMVRFHRDPVRLLRAIRHAARAGFTLTPETLAAVEACKDELGVCPTSRIRDELMRDILGGAASAWIELTHQTEVLYSLFPTLAEFYGPQDSPSREEAGQLLAKVDESVKNGQPVEDSVAVAAFLLPALEQLAMGEQFAEGRAGRTQWAMWVREKLPELAKPVAFAKRMVERMCQVVGVMAFVRKDIGQERLPLKLVRAGYFETACQLADILGHDLRSLAGQTPPKKSKRRRRRRRPRKKGQPTAGTQAKPKG